jgi:glycosyltransferase involved in cell wall biosynthesis
VTAAGKLAIFVPSLCGGGAERVMAILANGFASRGYSVDLLVAQREGPYLSSLSPDVRIVDFQREGVLACLPALVRYLRRERPRALLAALSHTNVVSLIANRLAGSPTRIVISERSSFAAKIPRNRTMRFKAMHLLMRLTYRWASAVVVVAQALGDELRERFGLTGSVIHFVPNPVVNADMLALARQPLDERFFPAGQAAILGAGRLTAQKDFETLIRAFALLRSRRDARLVILGEGPDRGKLESLVEQLGLRQHVVLPGFHENPFAFMRAADLFVLSSRYEGMPGVMVQAMACGTPVVSTDCPTGPAELLEGGRWGRLVPMGDPVALAEAMERTLAEEVHPDVALRAMDFAEEASVDHYLEVMLGRTARTAWAPTPTSRMQRA